MQMTLEIPDDLIAKANRIPGLGERVARFIKLEVAQYEMRQKRFRPETLALVARAQAKADEKRAVDVDLGDERQALIRHLDKMTTTEGL